MVVTGPDGKPIEEEDELDAKLVLLSGCGASTSSLSAYPVAPNLHRTASLLPPFRRFHAFGDAFGGLNRNQSKNIFKQAVQAGCSRSRHGLPE
jgi:hypothetical protein